MKNIVLSINGSKVTCPAGSTLLTAAEKNGIDIPTLCNHPDLKPYGACRMCLVEDEKSGRLMASCVTPAAQDMSIHTDTPRILNHRRNIVRLMIAEHPESCIVCNKGNRCELRRIAAQLGVAEPQLYPMPNYKPFETLNPFIVRDLSKCILCGKCIRADHELVCVGAIDYNDRGFASRPATLLEQPLENSRCTFCGTCVSICPTGALSAKNSHFIGTPQQEFSSICGFCGAGCSLSLGISADRVVEVNPSKIQDTVNGVTLCVRGHFAHDFLNSPDRLKDPMIRRTDDEGASELKPVAWDEALSMVSGRMADIKRKYGPESIGFIGSTKCTNEENFLFQKIARVIFETNNVASGGEFSGHKLLRRMEESSMGGSRISPLSDLENAEAIVAVMTDTEHTVPVAGYYIKRAAKNGIPLVVINNRRTDLSGFATARLGADGEDSGNSRIADILTSLASLLIVNDAIDTEFIEQHTENGTDFIQALGKIAEEVSGTNFDPLNQTADLIGHKKIAFVLGADLLEQENGEDIFNAAFNLALLTGSIGEKNAGFFIPAPENNIVGALDMGTTPDLLPGRISVADSEERKNLEKIWDTRLPDQPGLDITSMIEAAEQGNLKALFIMGENPLRNYPDPERVKNAVGKLEFIVVEDILHNETVETAHVILPGAAFAEKNGSFTNMEGRIQTFSSAVSPPGNALPDWTILAMLARKLGYPEQYNTIEKIRREIRQAVPMYAALENHRYEWVKKSKNSHHFAFSSPTGRSIEPDNKSYPYTAYISSQRWHLGGGTRTDRSERISGSGHAGAVEISPDLRDVLDLASDSAIRLISDNDRIERPFQVNPGLSIGQVLIPQGFSGNDVLRLVRLDRFKPWRTCRVSIEKI